jgi:hypothetical protein
MTAERTDLGSLCRRCILPECDEASYACLVRAHRRKIKSAHYQRHREQICARKRELTAAAPEKRAAANRRYYRKNRERILAAKRLRKAARGVDA